MNQPAEKPAHNLDLYAQLAELVFGMSFSIRQGKVFGCPALYVGRKMALCDYEDCIGMRVPEDIAVKAQSLRRAVPFTPYGKKPMR